MKRMIISMCIAAVLGAGLTLAYTKGQEHAYREAGLTQDSLVAIAREAIMIANAARVRARVAEAKTDSLATILRHARRRVDTAWRLVPESVFVQHPSVGEAQRACTALANDCEQFRQSVAEERALVATERAAHDSAMVRAQGVIHASRLAISAGETRARQLELRNAVLARRPSETRCTLQTVGGVGLGGALGFVIGGLAR